MELVIAVKVAILGPARGRKNKVNLLTWESLIWPLSPHIVKTAGSNLTIGTLVERVGSEHQS